MKAQASRQQQIMGGQLVTLAASVAESEQRGQVFRGRNEDLPLIWRVRQTDLDKQRVRFLAELGSRDDALLADPYLLARRPPPPIYRASSVDAGGLDVALEAMTRLGSGEQLSPTEASAFLFDVLGKIELPKQERPGAGDEAGTGLSTPETP
jgi:hypothetical protein